MQRLPANVAAKGMVKGMKQCSPLYPLTIHIVIHTHQESVYKAFETEFVENAPRKVVKPYPWPGAQAEREGKEYVDLYLDARRIKDAATVYNTHTP